MPLAGAYVSCPQVVRTRAICRMSAFTAAGVSVTLPPTRLDCLSRIFLRRAATEVPGADGNARERGQETCAGDGGALYLGLELRFFLYYVPLSCAHFRVEPVFSWLVSSRLLLFWVAMLAVVRTLIFWHVEEI